MTGASSNLDLRSRGLGPSSATVRYESAARRRFDWLEGYAVFSVSKSAESDAKAYIENQADHQQQPDFKEELLSMLRLHDGAFDARYLFD